MGIFEKQGVLNPDGTVTDAIWDGFVSDVVKKLSKGGGTIPGVQLGPAIEPTPGAQQLNLKNKSLFPDFHKDWRPRYEAMVRGIDADGAYQLSQYGAPIFDPTAMAKTLGAQAPPMKLPDALAAMTPAQLAPPVFIPGLGDPNLTEVPKLPEMTDEEYALALDEKKASSIAKMIEAMAAPPIPPIPQVPDVKLQELGYTEQYTAELNSALSPVLAYPIMTSPAGATDLAGAVAGAITSPPELPFKVIEAVGKQNIKFAPPSMETSSFEIAVNSTFEEHRAKYTAATMLAQNIGHGTIVDAMSATPFDQGGFEIIREPEEPPPAATLFKDPLSSRRYKILKIIEDWLGQPPNSYVSILENKSKFNELTKWEPPEAIQQSLQVKEKNKAIENELKEYSKKPANQLTIADNVAIAIKKAQIESGNRQIAALQKEAATGKPIATTCNAFPIFIMRRLGIKPTEYQFQHKGTTYQLLGGLDTMRQAARIKGFWVDAMSGPGATWDPSVGLPKEGDIFLMSVGNRLYFNPGNPDKLREKGSEPWDTDARHVGMFFDLAGTYTPEDPNYSEFWLTADAGQGAVASGDQRAAYVNRPVIIPDGPGGRILIMGEPDIFGNRKQIILAGWLDIDKLTIANEAPVF